MSKSQVVNWNGLAFIAGSFAFITILTNSDPLAIPGSLLTGILLAVGLSGLRARYGEKAGDFGRNILRIGVFATILFYVGLVALGFIYSSGVLPESQIEEGMWVLLFGGPVVPLLALTLFGLYALVSNPMAHLNWLPLFAGVWYPAFFFFLAGYLFTHHGVYPGQYQTAFTMVHLIQFIALCTLGAVLVSDTPQERAAA